MKTLTKIKLINWHGFYNETISVDGSVLITGENGTGKSTLIDAVYFVLTGGEENFNSAANTNNSRTAETYMRGKTGIEGSAFLRNDKNLISHIALEYYDTTRNEYFVIGVVLEIQEGKTNPNRSFYHIPTARLLEEYYVVDGEYQNYQGMKRNHKDVTINELNKNGKKGIRRDIYQILEMDNSNDRYYQLLPKAMAFKPIGEHGKDVNDFVYEFLMPEKNTDLEDIKTTINSYNEIREQLKQEKLKRDALKVITDLGDILDGLEKEKYYLTTMKNLFDQKKYQEDLNKCEKDRIKNEESFKTLRNKKIIFETQKESLEKQKIQISNSEEFQSLLALQKELETLKQELKEATDKKNVFNKEILSEVNDVANYIDSNINFGKYIKNEDYPAFKADLDSYGILIENLRTSTIRESLRIENDRTKLDDTKKELIEKKNSLSKGIFKYSSEITRLVNAIKEEGLKKFNKEISVTPLCEMLEIKPEYEKHRNAIEGYLSNHRFDLFVPEQYFDFALDVYVKRKKEMQIHSVGLVDSASIREFNPLENSLALMLEANDTKAQKYINHLLGNVIFTGSKYCIEGIGTSVDENVFALSNHAFRQKNPRLYNEPFIGIKSIKVQLDLVNEKLDKIEEELNALEEDEQKNNVLKNRIAKTRYVALNQTGNVWEMFSSAQTKYELKQREYDAVDVNQGLTHDLSIIITQLEEAKEALKECEDENDQLVEEATNIKNKRKTAEFGIEDINGLLKEYNTDGVKKAAVDAYIAEHPVSMSELDKNVSLNTKELESKKNLLVSKMGQYIKDFNFDAIADPDSLPVFYNELNTIVSRNLVTYEGRLEDVQKQATAIFQNSYIEEIRDNIRREQENIDMLNKVLRDRPFGSDEEVYQFVYSKSKDDRFGQYYDIFTSNQNFNSTNLFVETLSDKNANLMQELFERLTSDSRDANQEKLVREYTDYRKFMSYDIRITNKNGKDSYFSKIYKEKSGGETQTPFYVVIAASFDQIVKGGYKTRSPGCLVMFDEAFNNMDESRIESMMQYFNQLSIQPIIAVPTARAKSIVRYVGTSVILIKSNGRIVNIGWDYGGLSKENH